MLTDVQTPFLGTPLVLPKSVEVDSQPKERLTLNGTSPATASPRHVHAALVLLAGGEPARAAPNLPTETIPAKIRGRRASGKSPVDVRIPPLELKILIESKPPESGILVRRIGRRRPRGGKTAADYYQYISLTILIHNIINVIIYIYIILYYIYMYM